MTKYQFQIERITLQDMRVLFALAHARSDMVFTYLCSLLDKAGIDLEEMPLPEFNALTIDFMEQASAFLSNEFGATIGPDIGPSYFDD